MDAYRLNDLKITADNQGANRFTKTSYPVRWRILPALSFIPQQLALGIQPLLLGDRLAPAHYIALIELIRSRLDQFCSKGAIYLSPLNTSRNRATLLRQFVEIKNKSRLHTYLYLIQRL